MSPYVHVNGATSRPCYHAAQPGCRVVPWTVKLLSFFIISVLTPNPGVCFKQENAEKKKRAPPSAQRHSSAGAALSGGGAGGAPKRARKSVSTSRVDSLMGGGVEFGHGELDLFESGEDMLFEPDSFEELKAHAQRDAASRSDSAVAAADLGDDVDFSALATMQPQSQSGGDAWK